MNVLYIIIGLVFLIFGGDWLLKASVNISIKLKISKIVIGMTVVSFATSAPELIVSIKSALEGYPDLALGNVIGSNIANLALVLGFTTCLGKIDIPKSFYKIDWPMMMFASLLLYIFIGFDLVLSQIEGILLFALLIIFLIYLLKTKANTPKEENLKTTETPFSKTVFLLLIGGIGLWGGSELLIKGAVGFAHTIGISERIIGVTIVSIGTSIPELAASIIAIIKREKAISLGNLIGSNIFNILAVLGISSIITPIRVKDLHIVSHDLYWLLAVAGVILPLCFLPKRLTFGFKEGIVLLAIYCAFIYFTVFYS
ncbi:MAG: calcium/sodium antiporter [Wenyingzhuangia sp.]|uniref:calcium/sodium antiporter n=1 Tax=Wenyingzhuangia sp. TaxID=1964193 RepID=UPI00321B2861